MLPNRCYPSFIISAVLHQGTCNYLKHSANTSLVREHISDQRQHRASQHFDGQAVRGIVNFTGLRSQKLDGQIEPRMENTGLPTDGPAENDIGL